MKPLKNAVQFGNILGLCENIYMTVSVRTVLDHAVQHTILLCFPLKSGEIVLLQIEHPQFLTAAQKRVHFGLAPQLLILVRQRQTQRRKILRSQRRQLCRCL